MLAVKRSIDTNFDLAILVVAADVLQLNRLTFSVTRMFMADTDVSRFSGL